MLLDPHISSTVNNLRIELPKVTVRALQRIPVPAFIPVEGPMVRSYFTAGLFPALNDCLQELERNLHVTPFDQHSVAAIYLNLNSDNPKLAHLKPWNVHSICGVSGSEQIIAKNGVGLKRSMHSWVLTPKVDTTDYKINEIDPDLQKVLSAVNYALEQKLNSRCSSILFPSLVGSNEECKRHLAIAYALHKNTAFSPTSKLGHEFGRSIRGSLFQVVDALHRAQSADEGIQSIIGVLNELPQLIFCRGWCGGTILHDSCEYRILPLIEYVLDRAKTGVEFVKDGVKTTLFIDDLLRWQDRDGFTPLLRAAISGDAEIYKLLHSKTANVNSCDRYGYTAAFIAKQLSI